MITSIFTALLLMGSFTANTTNVNAKESPNLLTEPQKANESINVSVNLDNNNTYLYKTTTEEDNQTLPTLRTNKYYNASNNSYYNNTKASYYTTTLQSNDTDGEIYEKVESGAVSWSATDIYIISLNNYTATTNNSFSFTYNKELLIEYSNTNIDFSLDLTATYGIIYQNEDINDNILNITNKNNISSNTIKTNINNNSISHNQQSYAISFDRNETGTKTDLKTFTINYNNSVNTNNKLYFVLLVEKYYTEEMDTDSYIINYTESTQNQYFYYNGIGTPAEYSQEIIDIPGIMFNVLTMPFAFISTAFNLTLFPNTPYAVNIGNLILTILAILILMFLIRLILNRFR